MENEHRPSDSPYIERVYRSDGVSATGRMHSVASTHWELAVWTHRGSTHVAVRGPETRPSTVPVLPDDDVPCLTARTVQRRVVAATGLTRGAIRQIERARQAAMLLGEDLAPREVVQRLGYYDQPHLARSLARFIGRTATELRRPNLDDPVSLLYKTGR
jgi:hypothetical protein